MSYPFVASPNVNHTSGRQIDAIVIHTMEVDEKGDSAESCAHYFSTSSAQVSAHYCVDSDSIVQCVKEQDIAWHAPGANHNGIGIEHAGRAAQTGRDWSDAFSTAMLARSAALTAELCARHGIPIVWLQPGDLVAGKRGITSHGNVSKAFKRGSHWDPGDNFPVEQYLAAVRETHGTLPPGPVVQPSQGEPPTLKRDEKGWQVKRLQRSLESLGYIGGADAVDGVFGEQTEKAVLAFQTGCKLDSDGICGPKTWRALAEAIEAGSQGPISTDAHDRGEAAATP